MTARFSSFLTQPFLVQSTDPGAEELATAIQRRVDAGKTLTVMYGETYDFHGPTLDSLKYYFAVAGLARAVRAGGGRIEASLLIADIAVTRNEDQKHHDRILQAGGRQAAYVRALSDHFKLDLNVVLMSEYLDTEAFQDKLARVRKVSEQLSEIGQWLEKTVPPSKVEEEQAKGFAYAYEEVATILEFDLKVGPPRERFYDVPARMVSGALGADPLQSVYLRPTYPLGLDFDFFFANEEIEEFGVTAYKAGSKKLEKHRVIIGKTDSNRLGELVETSSIPESRQLPNPVLDLVVIAEMGEKLTSDNVEPIEAAEAYFRGELSRDELKSRARTDVPRVILEPLQSILERVSQT